MGRQDVHPVPVLFKGTNCAHCLWPIRVGGKMMPNFKVPGTWLHLPCLDAIRQGETAAQTRAKIKAGVRPEPPPVAQPGDVYPPPERKQVDGNTLPPDPNPF